MTIQQLFKFHLARIETEDRQALCKRLSALRHSVLSPWDGGETLFSREDPGVGFATGDRREQRLLSRNVAIAGDPERFYCGYQLLLFRERAQSLVSPLFMQEVEVRSLQKSRFRVEPADSDGIEPNPLLFHRQKAQPEELRSTARDLERHLESFDARLDAAFQAMGVPRKQFPPDRK
jgi:hypothetical protein